MVCELRIKTSSFDKFFDRERGGGGNKQSPGKNHDFSKNSLFHKNNNLNHKKIQPTADIRKQSHNKFLPMPQIMDKKQTLS